MRKDYGHLNLSEEAHNVLLDWHYKMGCDMNLIDESEVVNTKEKIETMPNRKRIIKKKTSKIPRLSAVARGSCGR